MADDELDLVRAALQARERDLIEARVGLAQAVATLVDELAASRRQAEAAAAEVAELREHSARQHASAERLAEQLEQVRAELRRLRASRRFRYAATAKRLLVRARRAGR